MSNGAQAFPDRISQDQIAQRDHNQQSPSKKGPVVSSETYETSEFEKWNHPRSNIAKSLTTFWSFLVMGANDSAYGVSSHLEARDSSFIN
jgi:hypothetical protein